MSVPTDDPRFVAALDLIGRTGAKNVQIRYDDDPEPTVWVVDAEWRGGQRDCAGGMTPAAAAVRLAQQLAIGGVCAHCGRPSGVSDDWSHERPMHQVICWFVFDPETATYRRSCEGDTVGRAYGISPTGDVVGRNDPCPCGSGQKWKRCHGA